MPRYCNCDDVLKLLHLKEDRVEPREVEYWIDQADLEIVHDLTMEEVDEQLTGNINGSNTIFFTDHKYIADLNYDSVINSLDVTVYAWGVSGNIDTKVEQTVSTINPDDGRIILASAPASTFAVITANYRYYPNKINFVLLKFACRALSAYNFCLAHFALIPHRMAHGPIRWRYVRTPYEIYYNEYLRLTNLAITRPYEMQSMEAAKLLRKEEV